MERVEELKRLYFKSGLNEVFSVKREDDYPEKKFSSLRFSSNDFRIRAIEIWEHPKGSFLRIYYSKKIAFEVKEAIDSIEGKISTAKAYSDFRIDFDVVVNQLSSILKSDALIKVAQNSPILTKNTAYEGLSLPDVDVSESEVLGRTFSWKEIIAISEEITEENKLFSELSNCGVYLQRSLDGKSRYVGSAYSNGGIFARWMKHLKKNGDAKHLNLFVLENGYNDVLFTVLEFTKDNDATEAISSEKRWKSTLGTKNSIRYDGFRLNNN